jgi:hypothetical protein
MLNEHVAPALTVAQVEPLIENSDALLLAIEDTITAALPVLLSVTARGVLDVPSVWSGIAIAEAIDSAPVPDGGAVATPVPDSAIESTLPPA